MLRNRVTTRASQRPPTVPEGAPTHRGDGAQPLYESRPGVV
jgi:hypothetical protein